MLVFCPLPPKQNGIAVYFAEQLPYLAQRYQCTVVIEDTHPEPVDVPRNVFVLRLKEYLSERQSYAAAKHLYHVGNNADSRYLLPILLTTPGIVVIHDLNLHHLIESQTSPNNEDSTYRDAVFQLYGRLGAIAGENITDAQLKRLFMAIDLPFNGSVISSAYSIIVHSEFSRFRVDAYQAGKTTAIPHHLSPIAPRCTRELSDKYKQKLNLPLDRVVIASMGFIGRAKQISSMLAALSSLKKKGLRFFYILAGQAKITEYDVTAEIRKNDLVEDVIVTGYLSEQDFFRYMMASDLIANLRYPSGGETSGTFIRAMGVGKCCIIVDIGPFSEVPQDCAVKIPWSDDFRQILELRLRELICDTAVLEGIGNRAKKWIRQTHDIKDSIKAYSEVINGCPAPGLPMMSAPRPGKAMLRYLPGSRIEKWKRDCGEQVDLSPHTGFSWWNESLVPLAEIESNLLVIAEDRSCLSILLSLYKYRKEQITFISIEDFLNMTHVAGFSQANSILAILPGDIFVFDPVEIFLRINWLSKLGSNIVTSILWTTITESEMDLSTKAFREYLRAAGFIVERTLDGTTDISFHSQHCESTCSEFCFKSRMASRMSDRYPRPFYRGYYSEAKLVQSDNLSDLINRHEVDTVAFEASKNF